MLVILYIALLIIYAAAVTNSIPGFAIFAVSALFFLYAFNKFKAKSNKTTAFMQIMCLSIPLSWRNIFGGDYGDLAITWFYIFGLFLSIHLLALRKEIKLNRANFSLVLLLAFAVVFSVIPLLLTNPDYFDQGLTQFIILTFHNIIIFLAVLKGRNISNMNVLAVEKSYILAGLATSIGLIIQYFLFRVGISIGVIKFYLNRQSFHFLISDVSHASLYLATTALLSIQLIGKSKKNVKMWIIPIIILIGAAITSARTGLVAFFIVYLIYIFVGQKGISRKVMSLVIGVVALFSAYSLYKNVRQQSSIRDILFDSSDRDNGYEAAYNLFLQNPIFGHGFSIDYISSVMGQPIPHLSFLQYLVHGGIFYTLILFGVIFVAFLYAKKRKMNASWLILLTVLGTCLVPDIFSTRYITLLIVLVFLENETANQLATKNSNVGISLANMARLNFSPIGKKMGVNRGQ
ncbi:O-antigen ligase family protein [Cohnella thailandensis]|uniref:O-antigen ligase family protein n=1 Tax=Cohnella thailandensis TaxID=557557 RepID=A0A841T7Y0_9BACL|nr:O-antigen ligase family protein [Cohnella thailandensis]MBP1971905.1 hypothetical protein [Cohnella thailandensis]